MIAVTRPNKEEEEEKEKDKNYLERKSTPPPSCGVSSSYKTTQHDHSVRGSKLKKKDHVWVEPLKAGNTLHTNSNTKAKLLLQQFKSVFTKQTSSTLPHLPPTYHPQITQIKITTPGVAKLLHELNPHKAMGPDGIPNTVLKNCANQIAPAFAQFINDL